MVAPEFLISLVDPFQAAPVSWIYTSFESNGIFGARDDIASLTGRTHPNIERLEWKSVVLNSSTGCPQLCMVQELVSADFSRPPRRFWRTSWQSLTRRLVDSSNMWDL